MLVAFLVACAPNWNERVDEAAADVAGVRHAFDVPPIQFVTMRQLKAQVRRRLVEQDPAQWARLQCIHVAFGLATDDVPTVERWVDTFEAVGGVYDPQSATILVVTDAGAGADVIRQVLRHELVHAYQFQTFSLPTTPPEDDAGAALRLVVEGDAMYTVAKLEMGDAAQRARLAAQLPGRIRTRDRAFDHLSSVMQRVYPLGVEVVQAMARRGGQANIDAHLTSLSASSEQVLDFVRRDDPPKPVTLDVAAALGPEWRPHAPVTIGMYGMDSLLWAASGASVLPSLDGWGGDRLHCLEHPDGRAVAVWRIEWDTPYGLTALENSLGPWLEGGVWDRRDRAAVLVRGLSHDQAQVLVSAAWSSP